MAELLYPISVLLMLLLFAVMALISIKYFKNGSAKALKGKAISVVDRQYLGDGKMVVSFLSGRTLVVCAFTSHGATKLLEKELSEEEAEDLLPSSKQKTAKAESFSFKNALKKATTEAKGEREND